MKTEKVAGKNVGLQMFVQIGSDHLTFKNASLQSLGLSLFSFQNPSSPVYNSMPSQKTYHFDASKLLFKSKVQTSICIVKPGSNGSLEFSWLKQGGFGNLL